MGQKHARPINREEVWKEEGNLSLEKRRERYRCRDAYVPIDKILTWEKLVMKSIEKALQIQQQGAREKILSLKVQKEKVEPKKYSLKESPLGVYQYNEQINSKIALIQQDITKLEIDAVVNAANRSLLGGGGIDGAIHRAAGDRLFDECASLNGCETGKTKITRGYSLPAKYVLHTVGPIGENPKDLESCYATCLELVLQNNIKTVAFCGVSTGIYGYPLFPASHIALNTIRKWLDVEENRKKIDLIIFCTYLDKEMACYERLMPVYFPPKDMTSIDVLNQYQQSFDNYDPSQDKELEAEAKKRMEEEERKKKEHELIRKKYEEKFREEDEESQKEKNNETDISKEEIRNDLQETKIKEESKEEAGMNPVESGTISKSENNPIIDKQEEETKE